MPATHTERYSGDVHLQRDDSVALRGAEDVYVHPEAVDGRLDVRDPEYVYVDATDHGTASASPKTTVTGDLEDGYVESVAGDVAIAEAEDVFVAGDAAEDLAIRGAEQVFQPDGEGVDPTACDRQVSGWSQDRSFEGGADLAVVGAKNCVETTGIDAPDDPTRLYIVGWSNELRLEGRGTVQIQFVGRDNRVSLGPYLTAERVGTAGHENVIDRDPIPPEALIETSKSDAYGAATLGRHRVTWQEPAPDEDHCPNCGADTETVIARRQRDAYFLFGVPIWTVDDGGRSFECPECSRLGAAGASLSEDERRSLLG